MKKILVFLFKEFKHVFPALAFFLVAFVAVNEIQSYLLSKAGMSKITFLEVFLAAALIAKVILVADHLGYISYFKRWPLVYPIVWKTLNYWVILLIIRLFIRLVPVFQSQLSIQDNMSVFLNSVDWRFFFSIQALYVLFLFIYVTFYELAERIGPRKIKGIFFGK